MASPPTQSLSVLPGGPLKPQRNPRPDGSGENSQALSSEAWLDILENTEAAGS